MLQLLILEAGRVVFGPILGRVWADVQQSAANRVEAVVKDWWKRSVSAPDITPTASESDRGQEETDEEIVQSMAQKPEKADLLRRAIEEILGITLSPAATGTDGAILSAYEAVMWRAAVVAGWEGRPIALAGALLGTDWVTVCKPSPSIEPGSAVDPASLWVTDDGDLVRAENSPVEFYVRRTEDAAAADLNERFIREPRFAPGPPGPLGKVWHRVDGLNRGWVRFRWDDDVEGYAQQERAPMRDLDGDGYMFPVNLDATRPRYSEFPPAWREAMVIADPGAAVRTLRQAIDEYTAANAKSLKAARAALKP
jgi:hypothetical protein